METQTGQMVLTKRALKSWVRFTRRVSATVRLCDEHAGLGGWVGAIGAIIAVFVAWGLARSEYQRALQVENDRMNAEINVISRTVSEFDFTVQKYLQLAKANDYSEAAGYYNKHLIDPERSRMHSIAALPITQWPSIESYDAFMRYLVGSNEIEMRPADAKSFSGLEQEKQEHDSALKTLQNALNAARK